MTKTAEKNHTPLMKQYHEIKSKHRDSILFFRLGDFYEMFGNDAKTASPVLEVALTKRQEIPMCGVPHHSVNSYIAKLLKKGFKVSICEQQKADETENGGSRRLFNREVVRVITPGTVVEENILQPKKNNFLGAISPAVSGGKIISFGCAWADISTGDFFAAELTENIWELLESEITKFSPAEIVMPAEFRGSKELDRLLKTINIPVNYEDDWNFNPQNVEENSNLRLNSKTIAREAVNAVLKFIRDTQPDNADILKTPKYYDPREYLMIDPAAVENLELLPKPNQPNSSLLEVIDSTVTTMGARMLRKWMLYPLANMEQIKKRQESVAWFASEGIRRKTFREYLKNFSDIERILSRTATGRIYPRDMLSLRQSLMLLPEIKRTLAPSDNEKILLQDAKSMDELLSMLHDMSGLCGYLQAAVSDDPPATFKQSGYIKKGFNPELDELKELISRGREWIINLESKERNKTGIGSLRVGYTNVFGYYIEVTKSNLEKVPADYMRKQTLTGAERFVTEELKEYESKILGAEEKIQKLEEMLLEKIKEKVISFKDHLLDICGVIAHLDCLACFADISLTNRYMMPEITNDSIIDIKDGRHPVVEKNLADAGDFVANDIYMDGKDPQILLITGPNMSGKSTYLRQTALIVILAQMGCPVPAGRARIGLTDQIFTRIGASDNLARGESTFMVEMRETSTILHNLSPRSLIILDEVGRGTSTFDGISIAWAVLEYLAKNSPADEAGCRPKTLFATHYFELTELEKKLPGVANFNVSVKEWKDKIIFLKKIVKGSADRSYGIHVAKLAELPERLISRAGEILRELENNQVKRQPHQKMPDADGAQLKLFEQEKVFLLELDSLNPEEMTPIEALKTIIKWKEKLKNGF